MGLFGRSKRKKRKAAAAKERKQIAENREYDRKAQLVSTRLNASFANPRVDPNQYADVSGGAFGGQGGTGGKAAPVQAESSAGDRALSAAGNRLEGARQRLSTQQANEEARNIGNRANDLQRENASADIRQAYPGADALTQSLLQGGYFGSFGAPSLNNGTPRVYGMYQGGMVPGYKGGTMKAGGK